MLKEKLFRRYFRVALTGVFITTSLLCIVGCSKEVEVTRVITARTPEIDVDYDYIEKTEAILNYVYKNTEKPEQDYMGHIDLKLEDRDNQRIYISDFLNDLDDMISDITGGRRQDMNYDSDVLEEAPDLGEPIGKETPNYSSEKQPNSSFILKDGNNREYIDVNKLDRSGDMFFWYNGRNYMLDKQYIQETTDEIRLQQSEYRLVYGEQDEDGNASLLYVDSKTGRGKTVNIMAENGKISFIDFEL